MKIPFPPFFKIYDVIPTFVLDLPSPSVSAAAPLLLLLLPQEVPLVQLGLVEPRLRDGEQRRLVLVLEPDLVATVVDGPGGGGGRAHLEERE